MQKRQGKTDYVYLKATSSAGVSTGNKLVWKVWLLFYARCPLWRDQGSNLQPQDYIVALTTKLFIKSD